MTTYTRTLLLNTGDTFFGPHNNLPAGTVITVAGQDLIVAQSITTDFNTAVSGINWAMSVGWITRLDGSTTPILSADAYVPIYLCTPVVTLTDKTKSFAIGIMSKINAIITKVNSLTGRMTAVENLAASKAAIDDTDLISTTTTLSASKIGEQVAQVWSNAQTYADNAALTAKNEAVALLLGVDNTQLEALNALSAALVANDAADGVITNTLLGKVGFTEAQILTDAQAAQARANIKFDSAVNAALLATVGDVSLFDPDAILATALTLN